MEKFHQKVKFKIQKSSDFGVFQSPEMREKKVVKITRFYVWFLVCSQDYRRMIKDLYLISGL
jgi:hypothetical protein